MAATAAMFHRLLAVNGESFAAGSYEVAYHTLAAAMHCAMELEAPLLLANVAQRADEQKAWIDAHAPDHALASQSAGTRGHHSIYGLLARQATTHAHILEHTQGHAP